MIQIIKLLLFILIYDFVMSLSFLRIYNTRPSRFNTCYSDIYSHTAGYFKHLNTDD